MGRQGSAEHPAHRRRPAAEGRHVQHRHPDRRVDRPDDEAGRDVQPAARHRRRADPAGTGPSVFGSAYAGKINSLWLNARNRSDCFPGNDKTRGFNAIKAILGELYGLDIQYYLRSTSRASSRSSTRSAASRSTSRSRSSTTTTRATDGRSLRVYIPAGVQQLKGRRDHHLQPGSPPRHTLRSTSTAFFFTRFNS